MAKKEKRTKTATVSKTSKYSKQKLDQPIALVSGEQNGKTLEPLMPELEELVKKNPNRLIGCGG